MLGLDMAGSARSRSLGIATCEPPRLGALGFDKHEVATAIAKTRTHTRYGGAADDIEQWIKIALSYCPKPRAS